MAADHIKVVFPLMNDMAKTFAQGSKQLEQTKREMLAISQTLSDGALLGRGGTAFTEAIRTQLVPAINRLDEKFEELQKDVLEAAQKMREADQTSKGMFS